ncbi:MAG: phage terminase large subunit [Thermomicrobiales bacterium]
MADSEETQRGFLFAVARMYFSAFLALAFAHIKGGAILKANWHHDALAYELDLIAKGKNKRLVIAMPPRNLKSTIVTVAWVTFMLGIDPSLNFVCLSYSDDLAASFARERLAIMESWWYKLIFPNTRLRRSATRDIETTAGGGCLTTSLTGTLTGRGGDIVVIDDPHKPEEALSPTTRGNVERWYRTTLLSRLNNKQTGAIILVMQRLHEDDLAGIVLEEGDWRLLSLPAIATEDQRFRLPLGRTHHRKRGEVLHPDHESLEALERLRKTMRELFEAQYQQRPVPLEGNLIKAAWLHRYEGTFVPRDGDLIVQSWDTASKDGIHNDWSVCLTAALRDNHLYLVDLYREKLEGPKLLDEINRLALLHRVDVLLIEDAASGTFILQQLRTQRAPGVPWPTGRTPVLDKQSRIYGYSSFLASAQVLLPTIGSWLGVFEDELLAFPNGRHDDQVDALSQLLGWFRTTLYQEEPSVPPIEGSAGSYYDGDDDDLENRPVELGGD